MAQISMQEVQEEELDSLAHLAAEVWAEHYQNIITLAQIKYMVKKFQSHAAIKEQLRNGYQYFWLCFDGEKAGYLAIEPRDSRLFLSKIYLKKEFRGKKIAVFAVENLKKLCKEKGYRSIYLTVNKQNAGSIAAYEAMGFERVEDVVSDIGNGYVMDDYIYELFL